MQAYSLNDLETWNERIEELVRAAGLDCYDQEFEICTYEDMLCYEAYAGMPAHYPHWSFGKTYERQRTFYQYNLVGLPYEMVINSDPCIAYLMRDNTLLLQILTMAHVYGHNDFFKNNRLFRRDTRAELTVEMFKAHADRVRSYIQDPSIGPAKVERILDAAHALRFQVSRSGEPPLSVLAEETPGSIPPRLEEDLLAFLAERGKLAEWEQDLVNIVRAESLYFIPQLETKIMNEGWASYWHYKTLQELELPQGLHFEFLQRHNLVIRPHLQSLNPYYVGFKMFEALDKTYGRQKLKEVRATERDQSFIRRFLTRELAEEMNLFSYGAAGNDLVIEETADEDGWKAVRDTLANSAGLGGVPVIRPASLAKGTLVLEHVSDGRELEMVYARETLKHIVDLWGGKLELLTVLEGRPIGIVCDEDKNITWSDRT
ncbi:MAG TPA: SpoVR family protein [Selenomonadales bacterium]|nr:SpoVR family protein [Selenomonadales bacterium]